MFHFLKSFNYKKKTSVKYFSSKTIKFLMDKNNLEQFANEIVNISFKFISKKIAKQSLSCEVKVNCFFFTKTNKNMLLNVHV